ncbi:MAG: hypothetical protein WDO71_16810 [Bacteroidota bacterium]
MFLFLAAINIGFSLVDPIILGRLINLATYYSNTHTFDWNEFLFIKTTIIEKYPG